VADRLGLPPGDRLWLGLLYMAYYQDGSAWHAFLTPGVRRRAAPPPADLPISVEIVHLEREKQTDARQWAGQCLAASRPWCEA
jgi:hypothetical protein